MQSSKQLVKFINAANKQKLSTPFMLVDTNIIREKCLEFKKYLPDIELFYAVKCFNDNEVLQAVNSLVDGYDVASVSEIEQLISLEVSPVRMAYSNPVKSNQDIKRAFELGVRKFAFQSTNELEKLANNAPASDVYLRMQVSDSTSEISFSSKFGARKADAVELLVLSKKLGLNPIGITFHVGSQAENQDVWGKAVKACQEVADELSSHNIRLELFNLGGGIPTQYSQDDPKFSDVALNIKQAVKNISSNITTMAEPGRYLVADSSVIVTSIIGMEVRHGIPWLFLDTGTFQSFFEVFEFGYFPYPVYSLRHYGSKQESNNLIEYALTGPSCDSYDTMTKSILLPKDLFVGDKLIVGVAGAYTVVYGSDFNGFKVPQRVYI